MIDAAGIVVKAASMRPLGISLEQVVVEIENYSLVQLLALRMALEMQITEAKLQAALVRGRFGDDQC